MREKAREFAKNNVPKPKVKARNDSEREIPENKNSNFLDELAMLDQRHEAYAGEVDKIKRLISY